MAKESNSDIENRSGGGDSEDGLDHAAQQISKADDTMLADLFVEANKSAKEQGVAIDQELFEEKKESYEFKEHVPDPKLLESIYDSLSNKDVHHKKLLEEGVSSNFFVNSLNKFKKFLNLQISSRKKISIAPQDWSVYSVFCKFWKKKSIFYLNDFSSQIDLFLRNKQKAKKIFQIEFLLIFSVLLLSVILMFFSRKNIASDKVVTYFWSNFIFYSSTLAFVLASVPPFFFFSLWFSNVNHLHNSRNFHFFLFSVITLSFIFVVLSLFSMSLYHLIAWRFPEFVGN